MIGHSELDQEQKKIIDGLHMAVEKNPLKLDLSLEEELASSRQLFQDLNTASDRMHIIGIDRLDALNADEGLSVRDLRVMAQETGDIEKDLDKEESYRHKNSKQEAAAIRRGEYAAYQTDKKAAARSAISQYKQYEEDPAQAPKIQECTGNEFKLLPGETDTDIADRICNLMRYRDRERKQLAQKKDGKLTECDKIYIKHREELIACMDDAIQTWYLANGADTRGGDAKTSAVRKAKKHLPLALEKYEYMVRNFKRLVVRDFLKTKTVKQNADYQETKQEVQEEADSLAGQKNTPVGMGAGAVHTAESLQNAILAHPQEYQAAKDKIDRLYAFYVQRMVKVNDLSLEVTVPQMSINTSRATGYSRLFDEGLIDLGNLGFARINALVLEAESAEKYIMYLLSGQKMDLLHGAMIERLWGENVLGPSGNSPQAYLAYSSTHAANIMTGFTTRKQELEDRLRALPDNAPFAERAALEEAVREMGRERSAMPIIQRELLARMDDRSINIRVMQHQMMMAPEVIALVQRRAYEHAGFNHIADAMVPIGQDPDLQLGTLVTAANDLAVVLTGVKVIDGSTPEGKTEQADAVRRLIQVYLPRVEDLKAFMAANPKMLEQRTSLNLFENSEHLSVFANKALALRDILGIVFRSPAFEELQPAEQDAFKTEYTELIAMANTADVLQSTQDRVMTRMSADSLIEQRAMLQSRPYDEYLSSATATVNSAYPAPGMRTYHTFL